MKYSFTFLIIAVLVILGLSISGDVSAQVGSCLTNQTACPAGCTLGINCTNCQPNSGTCATGASYTPCGSPQCTCPGTQVACITGDLVAASNISATCREPVASASCDAGSGPGSGTINVCGACRANAPRTVTRQYSSPGSLEEGHINISGNINFGGDLWPSGNIYLNDARSIRIDAETQTSFSIGNYNSSAGVNDHFQLRIHSPSEARSELIFDQGGDRWSISTRTPSRNLEIWRNSEGWGTTPLLSIDYASGWVKVRENFTVEKGTVLGITSDTWTVVNGALVVRGSYMNVPRSATAPTSTFLADGPGAIYYSTEVGNTGLKVYNGSTIGWTAVGGGGLATSGTATAGKISKFIGTPLTLTDSMLTENGNTVNVGGNITATGCFGAVFVGTTDGETNGDINSGVLHGYRAAHDLCKNKFSGSHMCSAAEIVNSISCGSASGASAIFTVTGTAWIANGAPALPTQTNDCNGWTYNTGDALINGVAWEFSANGGRGLAQTCDLEYKIACCN